MIVVSYLQRVIKNSNDPEQIKMQSQKSRKHGEIDERKEDYEAKSLKF